MDREHRLARLLIVAAVLLAALAPSAYLAWAFRDIPHLGRYHDDAVYFVTAKSLAQNGEYRILSLPTEPYQTKYPPLYASLLSIAWRLGPEFPANLPLAMLLSWAMLPIYLALSFVLFRDFGFSLPRSSLLCIALGWNFSVMFFSVFLFSDLAFGWLLLASLIVAERADDDPSARRLAALSGVFAGLAHLTRVAAMPLLVSVPLCFTLRKRGSHAGWFLVAALPFALGWHVWAVVRGSAETDPDTIYYTDYLEYYRRTVHWETLPAMFSRNLAGLAEGIENLLTSRMQMDVGSSFNPLLLLLPVSIGGVLLLVQRGSGLQYSAFAAGYVSLLLVWNFSPNERFAFPLLPLLMAGVTTVFEGPFRRARALFERPLSASFVAGAMGLATLASCLCVLVHWDRKMFVDFLATLREDRERSREAALTFDWIDRSLPSDATFLSLRDGNFYLRTGRQAVAMHEPPSALSHASDVEAFYASTPAFAARHRLTHLVVTPRDFDNSGAPELSRLAVDRLLDRLVLRELHRADGGGVYQFVRSEPDGGAPSDP